MSKLNIECIFEKYDNGTITSHEVFGHLLMLLKPDNVDLIYDALKQKGRWLDRFISLIKNEEKIMIYVGGASLHKITPKQLEGVKAMQHKIKISKEELNRRLGVDEDQEIPKITPTDITLKKIKDISKTLYKLKKRTEFFRFAREVGECPTSLMACASLRPYLWCNNVNNMPKPIPCTERELEQYFENKNYDHDFTF
jgi:hypothetical protein